MLTIITNINAFVNAFMGIFKNDSTAIRFANKSIAKTRYINTYQLKLGAHIKATEILSATGYLMGNNFCHFIARRYQT